MFSSIGFIGTGTMGAAVARAAVKGAQGAPVLLANRPRATAEAIRDIFGRKLFELDVGRICWPPWPRGWTPGAFRRWPAARIR